MRRTTKITASAALTAALVAVTTATTQASPAAPAAPSPQPESRASISQSESRDATALRRTIEQRSAAALRQAEPETRPRPPKPAVLQTWLDQLIDDGAVAVTARVDSKRLTWGGAAGVREVGKRAKAQPQDQFRVASNTKMMVATLVMQEVERGSWKLTTKVDDVIPGLFPGRDITIEQLLSHLSGAPDALGNLVATRISDLTSWPQFFEAIGDRYTSTEFIAMANALPWSAPDTTWSYSNAGYVALGVLLERVTSTDIATLLQERIFAPAGMRQTTYAVKPGVAGRSLVGAGVTSAGTFSTANFNPSLFGAAGAVVSTAQDLNTFTDALMDGKLVSRTTLATMMEPRDGGVAGGYGLGLLRIPDPCTPAGGTPQYLYGHNGASFGTQSWSLSSTDGTRQVSLGVTGRYYSDTDPTQQQPYAWTETMYDLMAASC